MNLLKNLKNLASDATNASSSIKEHWYITAQGAEGLQDKDQFSKTDPYLKVSFGGKNVQTRTINNDRSPQWNETFHFEVNSNSSKDISLTLMDDDVGFDDKLGKATVSQGDLPIYSGEEKNS